MGYQNGATPPDTDYEKGVDLAQALADYLSQFTADVRERMKEDFLRAVEWFISAAKMRGTAK